MSTKKSYLENLIFKSRFFGGQKRYGVATGLTVEPFIKTTRFFFQLLGFFPYFAMVYGFASLSRFLDPLQARPSKTGPELWEGPTRKISGGS